VVSGETRPLASALTEFLQRSLPDHMIPSAYVALERLPLTPNGKVDRAALPDQGVAPEPSAVPRTPPRTPLETQVALAWSEVLKVPTPGIDDDFFEAGGHSLLATQLLARLRARCAPTLTLRSLYDHPTIRSLAEWIAAQPPALTSTEMPSGPRDEMQVDETVTVDSDPS
jgi:aryl carrier-like protein